MRKLFSIRPVWREKLWNIEDPRKIYSQGDPATSVMYVQKGGVKLSVVNEVGKEAVVAILGPATFLVRGAWQVSLFEWGLRPRLHPRLYSLLRKTR